MATARLINPREVEDGTSWTVDTWPVKDGPFEGPLGRDWDDFRVTPDGATYQWRTPADRVRRAAEQVKANVWTLRRALKDPAVHEWFGSHSDTQLQVLLEEVPEIKALSPSKQDEALFRECAAWVGNEGWYGEDDDAYLTEAAEALDLPRWARVWRHGEGGPGSGFIAAAFVLAKGKTLDDLAAWLSERAARGGASSRRGTR